MTHINDISYGLDIYGKLELAYNEKFYDSLMTIIDAVAMSYSIRPAKDGVLTNSHPETHQFCMPGGETLQFRKFADAVYLDVKWTGMLKPGYISDVVNSLDGKEGHPSNTDVGRHISTGVDKLVVNKKYEGNQKNGCAKVVQA